MKQATRGFVLVATLWTLAILAIAVGFFAERVHRAVMLAQQKQETAGHLVAFANTRAEVIFRLATLPPTAVGFGQLQTLYLDDTPYRGLAGDVVRVQDTRGLVNVNFVEPVLLSGLLTQVGVPVELRDAMLDTLRDYTDDDNLRRLSGAEAGEYTAAGLPPPPNDWLSSPHQLQGVLGWRENRNLWERHRLLQLVTTARVPGLNPNTAPLEVLATLPGISKEVATVIVQRRRTLPILRIEAVPGYIPNVMESDHFLYFVSNSVRLTHQARGLPWALQAGLTMTPWSEKAPWRSDYSIRTVVSYAVENEAEIPKLPPWLAGSQLSAAPH